MTKGGKKSIVETKSRQRLWQMRRRAEGRCELCRTPLNHYIGSCDACAEKRRLWARKRRGYKPWRPGGKGRPPKMQD